MVILEAMAVGTPVLVMPSCGFAEKLKRFEASFVADSEDLSGLIDSLNHQKSIKYLRKSHTEIINFCAEEFGIESVTEQLLGKYKKALSYGN